MVYKILEGSHELVDEILLLWQKSMEFHKGLDPEYFSDILANEHHFAAKVEDYIDSSNSILLVLQVNGQIAGFILADIESNRSCYNSTKYCNIEDIMVEESLSGRGFGKMLMERALQWGRDLGAKKAKLMVHADNPRAISLYQGLGFQNKLLRMEAELETFADVNPRKTLQDAVDEAPLSPENLHRLLPLACEWAEQQERFILASGVKLDREYKNFALSIGVKETEKVRLLKVDKIPTPSNLELKKAAELLGLIGKDTLAITFRHGIYIRSDNWYNKSLVVHELCHTMQYERIGGIQAFLEKYLSECLSDGYSKSPLEQEAVRIEKLITPPNVLGDV